MCGELPLDFDMGVDAMMDAGLTMDDLKEAVCITATRRLTGTNNEFRYFMGVCKGILNDRINRAVEIVKQEEGDGNASQQATP